MRSLQQCLLDIDLVHLRAIARFWDVELTAGRQRDAAAALAEAMTAPEAVIRAWEMLATGPRRALEKLLAAGGKMPLLAFTRDWGEIRMMGPARMEREQPWLAPISPAEGLWYSGFIYRAFEQGAAGAYEVVFVPPELLPHLPVPPTPPQALTLEAVSAPSEVRADGEALLDDTCTLLAYLQNEHVRPDADGNWPSGHTARLARQLRDPDPARLAFLRHLVQRLGWLRTADSGRVRPEPAPVTAWLQSPATQQLQALATAWRDDPTWNDLFHVPTLRPEDTCAWRNDPSLARQSILRHRRACTPGAWYSLDGFIAAVKQADPDFQRPGGDYTTWYIRDAATGAYLSGFESWDAVEGALIRYLLTGPLTWLGLVNLGSPPASFRLTPAGAVFLGLAGESEEVEQAQALPIQVRADFTVVVPPARRYERFQLSRVADWVSSPSLSPSSPPFPNFGRGRGLEVDEGPTFVYRITPTSLERARRQGIPVARVLDFLSRVTGAPAPRFVEAALKRWEMRGAEARIERAVLLRLSSEELMAQVASSPPVRRLIREQVGPSAALVNERDWPRLIPALGEIGLLPDVIALEESHAG
jgi:hypothetical protein